MKKLSKLIFLFFSIFLFGVLNIKAAEVEEIFNLGDTEPSEAFASTDDYLFFFHEDEAHGNELWVTDGTPDGTKMVKDITVGPNDSAMSYNIVSLNNKVYFSVDEYDLWVSDGTEEGTHIVKEIGYSISGIETINNMLIFNVSGYNFAPYTIFVSDGTEDGTNPLVIDEDENIGMPMMDLSSGIKTDDYFYFVGFSKTWSQIIWRTNGTVGGTNVVWQTNNGNMFMVTAFQELNDQIIGNLNYDSEFGEELWITDNSENGVHLVKDIIPGEEVGYPLSPFKYNNKVYFIANDPDSAFDYEIDGETETYYDQTLFVTDGTESGTHPVSINDELIIGSDNEFAIYDDKVYIISDSDSEQRKFWATDMTNSGSYVIKDFDTDIESLTSSKSGLYFRSNYDCENQVYCTSLYYSDGSSSLPVNISDDFADGVVDPIYLNGYTYFIEADPSRIDDGEYGNEFINYRLSRYSTPEPQIEEEPEEEPEEEIDTPTDTDTETKNVVTTTKKTTTDEEKDEEEPTLEINSITSTLTETEVDNYNFIIQEKAGSKTLVDVYDINLLLKGQKVQPDGTLEIRILMTDKQKNYENLEVLYIDDNNNVTVMPHTIDGNYIVFTVNHLSKYVLVGDVKEEEEPVIDIDDKEAEEKDINPIIYIAAGALILVIIIIIFVKKKSKKFR